MREQIVTADRLTAFSDAVMAVIITIMVLELKFDLQCPDPPCAAGGTEDLLVRVEDTLAIRSPAGRAGAFQPFMCA